MRLLKRAIRDEKGASMIMVAVAIVMIFGFAVLTIDLSLMQLAKNQLQNAADAAALAGAVAWVMGGDVDSATTEAIKVAGLNVAIQDIQRPVIITEHDVEFPNKIWVRTHRTKATNDPVTLYFLKVLDPLLENEGEMTATASAKFFPVCGTNCLRPFCLPDRWNDDGDSTWEPGEPYHPLITGYRVSQDIGDQIILKLRQPHEEPRMNYYYAVNFPPRNAPDPVEEGVAAYSDWIIGCEPYMVTTGDQLQIEPDPTVGSTTGQWLEDLINQDPTAEWDPVIATVINSAFPTSPRIIKVCAFDPTLGVQSDGARNYVTVSKILVIFIEGHNDDEIVGRFVKRITQGITACDWSGDFLFKVALVPSI